MTTVLITGGSGRLGRSVVAGFAAAGHTVISLDRDSLPADPALAGVTQESVDLLDAEAVNKVMARHLPDAVIHLAAIAVPFSAPEDVILKTNTMLAYNVFQAATSNGVRRVVTASSPTVLGYGNPSGWLPDSFPLDEKTTPKPWNAYALSKLVAEQVMRMFAAASGEATRYAAFRPCYVISPEEWEGAPTQQGHTLAERLADPALSAPALFNYVDARDVADFLAVLLEKMDSIENAQVFFVGAADALAIEPLDKLMPDFLPGSEALAAGLTGTSPAFSIAKAQEILGWTPQRSWRTELTDTNTAGLRSAAAL
ncbi:NAD-dependent epimerase/dehydratase [Arthrobacter psychrolactophilus]|uniref:NAD-dependent epimerase/dehydratase n=1 Tax=Arthrobacter psychrolactophilus TaxID=92442 RepID=A0A2V5J802_9MICC|nr:NAD(P)-dependent oxidoreductase [Arthrobacter psychrolactophilus]PYI39040.1 NAD-dependent epimerase/dehydratase [Arthrobacter psychrolactophilus]